MYLIEAWSARREALRQAGGTSSVGRVHPTVWALGWTSFFTDVSSEMVSTVLPIYLVFHLGLTPFHYGIVDGLYHGVTAVLRLGGGMAADRSGRCREVALAGYAVSAASRLGLLLAGASWPLIAAVVGVDRAAKGLRTVPRDLLISLTSHPSNVATSFGVHRALDSAGAMLGPLVALGILAALPESFDLVFVTSFSVAIIGLGVLWLFVPNSRARPKSASASASSLLPDAGRILQQPGLLRLTLAATLLSAATVSDGFIYLVLQREVGFSAGLFPLLYVGTACSYLLLAVPAGRLADKVSRRSAFVCGYGLLALVYLVVMQPEVGLAGMVGCLGLLGGYYALTDGVLMALASRLLPEGRRGTGMAVVTTATSVTRLVASLVFGALWTQLGSGFAFGVFLAGLLLALSTTWMMIASDGAGSVHG